jgi:23S rRNA (cytosine1962-C5)-methyltransferase
MDLAPLVLKKKEERRLLAGHLWVFSNEVDTDATPLTTFQPGQLVSILASSGKILGVGYVNPHSLICARLLSRGKDGPSVNALFAERIRLALSLREQLFEQPFYRLVYGEGDLLPGLVVDRYGDILVVQMNTAGMENLKGEVIDALIQMINSDAILLRNDSPARLLEGLALYTEIAHGQVPEEVLLNEQDCAFHLPLGGGQKTGWFYDHRLNRARMLAYIKSKRVLDVFSYLGAWAIPAAVHGATQVTCIEASETALAYLRRNAERNQASARITPLPGDAFAQLKALQGERFDVVILDPPAFIKRKKDLKAGIEAYRRLNRLAMRLLPVGGILISASCSFHLSGETFVDILRAAALEAGRQSQILERGHQGPDHPIHPAIPETDYLKTVICRVV